jgi:hypothetical protein
VSSRPHAQLEEEDPMDEGTEDEGRSGREGERWALQRHPAGDPYEARVESKVEGQHPAPTTSDDDTDLLDDESPLIKDESPSSTSMDINMVFTLPSEFRGAEEESLRCVSAQKRSCSRSLKSRAGT